MKKTIFRALSLIFFVISLVSVISCKKFLEISPPKSELVTESVFQDAKTATAALVDIYSQMFDDFITYEIPFRTGLYGDELFNWSTSNYTTSFYHNQLDGVTNLPNIWNTLYDYIYQANAVLEGCAKSTSIDGEISKQLMAEARFIRAFWYFYLVNFYGDVPLITTTDYMINSKMPRTAKEEIYSQIVVDLLKAKAELNSNYIKADNFTSTSDRIRPNQSAAAALLARTYLFMGRFQDAEKEASFVIDNKVLYDTVPLNEVSLSNNKESIWQIPAPSNNGNLSTQEGNRFILVARPNTSTISSGLIQSFENGDQRKANWLDTLIVGTEEFIFPFKYKVRESSTPVEQSSVLRLAEQFLIRAEARAYQGNLTGAMEDLNIVRHRAGLPNSTAATEETLLDAILHERQVELFTEWGHRWMDLKRTGKIDQVMNVVTPMKGGTWQSYKAYWPIPQTDINNNPNLEQTPGYN